MGFKLKSGNASAFKNLGSSPAKQGGNNLKRIMAENKAIAKAAGTFYPPPADFNVKGGPTKTPGHGTTKLASKAAKLAEKLPSFVSKVPQTAKVKTGFSKSTPGSRLLKTAKHTLKKAINHPVVKNIKSAGKQALSHPIAKKAGKVLKVVGKINPIYGIMPAPLVNPTGKKYKQNQEG